MIQIRVMREHELYDQSVLAFPGVAERLLLKHSLTGIAALEEDETVGLLLLKDEGERISTEYVYVMPEYRRKGIGTRLLIEASQTAEDLGRTLQCTVSQRDVNLSAFGRFVSACGFHQEKELTELCFSPDTQAALDCWEKFKTDTETIFKRTKHRGYECVSFEEGHRYLKTLNRGIGEGFEDGLNPFKLEDLSKSWSFICINGKEPTAFLAASLRDNILDIKQFSCSRGHRNTGAALLPLYEFVSKVMTFQNTKPWELWKVRFAVSGDEGGNMLSQMLQKRFGDMCIEKHRVMRYVCK